VFVEEYNPLSKEYMHPMLDYRVLFAKELMHPMLDYKVLFAKELINYPSIELNYPKNEDEDYTVEPTEHGELFPLMSPIAHPRRSIYTTIPTEIAYNPISLPTRSMSYSFYPSITNAPSITSGVYTYAPFAYSYKSMPPINNENTSYSPSTTDYPTYSPSANNVIEYSYYSNDKYNIVVFGIATSIGSLCFCIIFVYVYKIYTSKKYKLQKIKQNALKREYERLNNTHDDYNSKF
jgi:hypothetical protein